MLNHQLVSLGKVVAGRKLIEQERRVIVLVCSYSQARDDCLVSKQGGNEKEPSQVTLDQVWICIIEMHFCYPEIIIL